MNVITQSVNFNADGKLLDFAQKRLDKLDLFYDRIIKAEVFLKVENTSAKENKIVDIKLHIPKDVFVVKKQCKSFEEAIDNLGGLDVEVGKPLCDHRDNFGRYCVSESVEHMDGETSLWYVRSRYSTSDFDRGRRQQEVVKAGFRKLLSINGIRTNQC